MKDITDLTSAGRGLNVVVSVSTGLHSRVAVPQLHRRVLTVPMDTHWVMGLFVWKLPVGYLKVEFKKKRKNIYWKVSQQVR